jgi:hypothetical protein
LTLSTATPIYRKTSVAHGLDEDKPTTPQKGDEYLATDTKKLYVCYEVGVWEVASPLSVNGNGVLKFDNKTLFSIQEAAIPQINNGIGGNERYDWDMNSVLIPKNTPIRLKFVCAAPNTTTGTATLYVDGVVKDTQTWTNGNNYTSPVIDFEKAPTTVYVVLPNSMNTWRNGNISGAQLAVVKVAP